MKLVIDVSIRTISPVFPNEFLHHRSFCVVKKIYFEIYSGGTYRAVIRTLMEYEKAQIGSNLLDVAAFVRRKNIAQLFHLVINRVFL